MVIDALKTVGGNKWFRVVERTGMGILFVRDRYKKCRQDFAKKEGQDKYQEWSTSLCRNYRRGGIIGYDSNLYTGGRTLGIGISRQYHKDVVTVSMRAVGSNRRSFIKCQD